MEVGYPKSTKFLKLGYTWDISRISFLKSYPWISGKPESYQGVWFPDEGPKPHHPGGPLVLAANDSEYQSLGPPGPPRSSGRRGCAERGPAPDSVQQDRVARASAGPVTL